MAFNRQTFRTRTLTAIVFVIVMLAGLLINHWTFFILFSIIHFGCWIEYQKLVGLIDKQCQSINSFHKYGIMLAGWCIMLYFTNDAYSIFGWRLHELGEWGGLTLIFVLLVNELVFVRHIQVKNFGHSLFGLVYISLSWGLMMNLYKETDIHIDDIMFVMTAGYFIPAIIIGSIWINDTMAYIVGTFIGKNSLSKISPQKTWEGTIGGIILSILIVSLVSFYGFHFGPLTIHLTIVSAISAIAGTFGDLLESKLKRIAGVKDSGTLMPGHGGFLDRFDSLLLAIPFVWLYIHFFVL